MLEKLKEEVFQANMRLYQSGLVLFNWGNVSGIDQEKSLVAIKPSGVDYDTMRPEDIVIIDLWGKVIWGELNPSSDTETHLELYRNFEHIGGICHTHSKSATAWAQARRGIPCFGTTHADAFYGEVPVTEPLTEEQIADEYELNTGRVIVEKFNDADIGPSQMPAVLVAHHGPFTWGKNADDAVKNAIILEECADIALKTISLNHAVEQISRPLLDKHYQRKHGKNAYYGQG
ncbi:L-ribulose-5-phosphate 4-epimerase UlaF [Limihaloglobus sulfuriphilus]|uniref:L-ribulose-5-phosphate 4-epimerase n=1 Tax=Limihaloglobus sulfuriphilus TaxID=1851148 RepID=A0A1Q2MGR2_9BACT|nr:L-ribulose-5-phosphate 4-epimerase [Limihaloglobus sulfuriphilus]AQQ71462.1 L-ribulose-5-phosphate 4-epimerase UlaF [Limihaloglobus sulfuriphilus]